MRVALLAVVVALTGCAGHRAASPSCTLGLGPMPSPETGEHPLVVTTSCAVSAAPRVELLGLDGGRLPFTYVQEGGTRGTHEVLLDKYRCDIRSLDQAHTAELEGARLDLGRSLLDWCPAEAISTVIHVYLGGRRRARATWRGVLQDVYDGRLDRVWPCGAVRNAIAHLPQDPPTYSTIPGQLARATAPACDVQLADLAPGAPRAAVNEALGTPDLTGPRCPVWRWHPEAGSADGARICFAHGRATLVQTALHG